ncbi:MAG: YggT family protein [Pseudomonadota bacterium]
MFVLANIIRGVATVLSYALYSYMYVVIAQAVLSWVNPDPYNPIVRFLYSVTQPVFYRVRRLIPTTFGGIDFSPMIVLLAILFLMEALVPTLLELASRLE